MPTQVVTAAVAGPFRAMYTGVTESGLTSTTLGVIGEKGIRQIRTFEGEDYSGDLLGGSIVESVYLGGNMFLEFELEEANRDGVKHLMNPFRRGDDGLDAGQTDGVDPSNYVGVPGTFATSYAGSLVLNPLYSETGTIHTTAGAQTTPVRTYGLVALAAGFQLEQLLASRRRVIPIRLRCFPYSDGGDPARYIWYSLGAVDANYYVS